MARPAARRGCAGLALLVLVAIAGSACDPPSAVHSVRGRVVRVAEGGRSLVVAHEAIPGTMEAMEMTLPLLRPEAARDLAPGDAIRFELHLQGDRAAIGEIAKLPRDTELSLPGGAGTP